VTILSDEIYAGLVYDRPPVSLRQWDSSGIVVSGFSKLFAMTGWRLGYAIVPPPMLRTLQRLQQNLFISPPDFAQIAATAALREAGPAVEAMRREYDRRRRYLIGRLEAMGLPAAGKPAGAFYLFLNVSAYTRNVYRFSFDLLEQAGVAVAPGVDFGEHGEGYIRICYAASLQQLEEGMDRIARFLERRPRLQPGSAARA
jgi:aspartate/methionine/tyrosine aminotransferase